jgi:MFS transporter, PAT family, beta-lactamase induction signal transducer AmpG
MKSLEESPGLRLITLCALYIAQGIPFGFLTITLAAYLAERNVSAGDIGHLAAMCSLPWALKWIWGPVIDRFTFDKLRMGRRRPWILLAQSLMMITVIFVVFVPDLTASVRTLGWIMFIHNIFASLQDVSADALAVDMLTEDERGRANGMMYGSSYFGAFLGGACLGWVTSQYGLVTAMTVQLYMLGMIMLAPLLLKENPSNRRFPWSKVGGDLPPAAEGESNDSFGKLLGNLLKAFSLRAPLLAAGLAILVSIGSSILLAIFVTHMTQKLGWTAEEYTSLMGGSAVFFGLGGSIAGGFLADKVGQKRLAAIALVLLGVLWFTYASTEASWGNKNYLSYLVYVQEFLISMMTVSLFSLFMSVSWPVVAGTQFTAYMALMNMSRTIGSWLTGFVEGLPIPTLFIGAGILQISLISLLWFIDPTQTRRVLGHGPGGPDGPGEPAAA